MKKYIEFKYVFLAFFALICNAFAQTTVLPVISSISPDKFEQGKTYQGVKITGSGFVKDLTIKFSKEDVKLEGITEVDASYIKCNISVKSEANPGKIDVTVTNSTGESGTGEKVITIISKPAVTGVSPKEFKQASLNKELVISGAGFMDGCRIEFAGGSSGASAKALYFKSDKELKAFIDVNPESPLGNLNFTVKNPDGAAASGKITIATKMDISSIFPQAIPQGGTNEEVCINGSNFTKGCKAEVKNEGILINSMFVLSETEIVLNLSISETVKAGAKEFKIISADGGVISFSLNVTFKPYITLAVPSGFYQGLEGKSVTITGGNFVKDGQLILGASGITINFFEVKTQDIIIANITLSDRAPAGQYDITYINPDGGTGTGKALVKVNLKPEITKVLPASAVQGVFEQNVEIQGSGLTKETKVKISGEGIVINSSEFISPDLIKINITVGAKSPMETRDITVSNPDGASFSMEDKFSINRVDKESIYYGDINKFKKPAMANKKRIFKEHPYYQAIVRENISSDVAKYWLIINKINEYMKDIYKRVQRKYDYDLIGKTGFITDKDGDPVKDIPDITDLIIKELER